MNEKRNPGPRVAVEIQATLRSAGIAERATILNLGVGGVFVRTDSPLPVDSFLHLSFHLPGNADLIDVQGRVVWLKQRSESFPAGMGLQFVDMPGSFQNRIRAFIEALHASLN